MPRAPKPWFRADRNAYFVTVAGARHNLGPDKAEAHRRFHALLAAPAAAPAPQPGPGGLTAGQVFEKYLGWCQRHRSPRTYEWARGHIQAFCDHLRAARTLPARDLRPFHVAEWVDSKTTWGANQRRGAVAAVTRPFNWAAKMGYIDASPVRGVERPAPQKRRGRMGPDDFRALLAHVKDEPFRDLLVFAYEAGVRPQEARQIEARHVNLDRRRIEIPPEEAKGKKRWRVVYLSDAAAAVVANLVPRRPDGPLFRNTAGDPWKAQALCCRFGRLKGKVGRRFAMYDLRHLFATNKLKAGRDPITVAALLGHKDGAMLCRHYEELSADGGHLLAAVNS